MATKSLPLTSDYLIVGGGTAGLVVACRLSEDPALNIVVLESGPDRSNDPQVQNPDAWHSLSGSDLDWKLNIVPQVGSLNKPLKQSKLTIFFVGWPQQSQSSSPGWKGPGWIFRNQWTGLFFTLPGRYRCLGKARKPKVDLGIFPTVSPEELLCDILRWCASTG